MALWRCEILTVPLIVCLTVVISRTSGDAANYKCSQLEKVFEDCSCVASEESSVDAVVDCSSKGLTDVPIIAKGYTEVIYKLILKNNSITSLKSGSFQGLAIQHLDLTGNALTSVEKDAFVSMETSLLTLEIDGDLKSQPPIHALVKLKSIQHLTMRNYNVSVIDQDHHLFLSFVHLKSLTLDNWNTGHMESESFLGLNNLQTLSLLNLKELVDNLPIDALVDDHFDNLETLRISHSKIKKVTPHVFSKLTKLKNLDLSNNEINTLDENCFYKVEDTLENINLNFNRLKNDGDKLAGLSGLEALTQLDLSNNLFKKIPEMPNLGAKKPFSLLLNHNEITIVQENTFNGYASHLSHLSLEDNYITSIDDLSFREITQLVSLDLKNQRDSHRNPIRLPSGLINSASSLQNVILSENTVDSDNMWNIIKDLTSLKTLDLNSASIQSIPDFTFQKVTELEDLDLSYNSISDLRQESLVGLVNLKRLNLDANSIQTIPSCLFDGFQSPRIVIGLGLNPIKCDCKIRKLIENIKSNHTVLATKKPAKCTDQVLLASLEPEFLVCSPPHQEEDCKNYYTIPTTPGTDLITPDPVTTPDPPKLQLNIIRVTVETITASWSITDKTNLEKYGFEVTSANSVVEFTRDNLPTDTTRYTATGLPHDTHVTTCVTAHLKDKSIITECKLDKTKSKNDPGPEGLNDDNDDPNTAIIVGCAVAGVAFIGVVVAIVILVVFRRRPKKVPDSYMPATQPRNFAKAELPSMTDETRRFAKPKKNVKSPNHPGMQVVAISDGQTSPGPRVGRANKMFEPEEGYEPMNNLKLKTDTESSFYENDHGALPPTPGTPGQDSRPPSYPGGYYNQAFKGDKYDEIEI